MIDDVLVKVSSCQNEGSSELENNELESISENGTTIPVEVEALENSIIEIKEEVKINDSKVDDNTNFKEMCCELFKECLKVQLQNEKYAESLRLLQKVTRRMKTERSFLMKKLDGFGDNYKEVPLTFLDEEIRSSNSGDETSNKHTKKIKRKLKVKRLQNAPKKPSNAFLMFCQKNRSIVQKEHRRLYKNEIGRQEMTRRLAEIWKETPAENKKTYYEMYEKDKARYVEEMEKFEYGRSVNASGTSISGNIKTENQ